MTELCHPEFNVGALTPRTSGRDYVRDYLRLRLLGWALIPSDSDLQIKEIRCYGKMNG